METNDYSTESGTPIPRQLRILLRVIKVMNGLLRRKNGTLRRRLSNLLESKLFASKRPVKGVSSKDIVIDSGTGVWVRVFIPSGASDSDKKVEKGSINGSVPNAQMPIIFYFHGGGFAILSAKFALYDLFCRRLSRRCQAVVISVDYRRAPEHPYPTAYEDSFSALNWFQIQGRQHLPPTADFSHCILMGDSAGGNIVHHVGCRAARAAEDIKPMTVVGHVLLFPFFGGEERTPAELRLVNAPLISTENTDWHWRAFLPPGSNRDHPAANVFGPNAPDISGLPLPPSLVIVGEYDPLKDRQIGYVEGLTKANKEVQLLYYKGGVHSFHLFHKYKLASVVLSDLEVYVKEHC